MVDTYLRQSALAHLGLAGHPGPLDGAAGVTLGEHGFAGIVNLRAKGGDKVVQDAVRAALGVALPLKANTVETGESARTLWLGPEECWVVTSARDPEAGPRAAAALRAALAGHHGAVTDVSESRTCIQIRGPKARAVLQKGCPLDFHASVFTAGMCAQSHLAKVDATIDLAVDESTGAKDDDAPVFNVYVLRSCAEYAWRWLVDAGREYGVAIAP